MIPLTTIQDVPDGNAGNLVTLSRMRDLILGAGEITWAATRALLAEDALLLQEDRDPVLVLWEFVHSIPFKKDSPGIEEVTWPDRALVDLASGRLPPSRDCDDLVVLLGAMLHSLGYRLKLVATSVTPDREWAHVYLEVWRGTWIPLDPAEAFPAGWSIPLDERTSTAELIV